MAASRTPARAARSAAINPVNSTPGVRDSAEKFPLMPASASASAPVVNPLEAPPPPVEPAPAPERLYSLEIRLDSPALTGDSAYHVTWPESQVRRLLNGALTWVPVPTRAHLPGQAAPNAARFVYIQAISEVIIHGWSQDDLG